MPTIIQRSFTGGEISPALQARTDFAKYSTSLKTIRNCKVKKTGGAENRSGTQFIGEVKDSTKTVRMLPFIFNSSQTYILEFGDLYIRVIRDQAYVTDLTLTITGISNANPGVVTYTGVDPVAGQEVYISGVVGAMANYVNGRNFKVGTVDGVANTFQLKDMTSANFNTTSLGSYTSGGTAARIYTVTTTYTAAELPALRFVQSADVVTLVHPSHNPRTLSRSGHSTWTLADIDFSPNSATAATGFTTNRVPGGAIVADYYLRNVDSNGDEGAYATNASGASSKSDTVASVATPTVLTWVAGGFAQQYNIYKGVGAKATHYYLATVDGDAITYSDTGGVAVDRAVIPSDPVLYGDQFNTANYRPSVVALLQQRLALAASNTNTETIFMSKIGDYYDFWEHNYTAVDADALSFIMSGNEVNKIKHIVDLGNMVILTSGGEHACMGGENGSITPTQVNRKQFSYHGSSDLTPIVIGHQALFVQEFGNIVRNLFYNYEVNGYDSDSLVDLSYHLFEGHTIVSWSYQKTPYPIVWCVRDDGVLLGLTYDQKQQVLAWHRHDFDDGLVEDVCCIPDGTEHAPFVVVKRTINARSVRYIERASSRLLDDIVDATFMDSHLTYDGRNVGATTLTLSGGTTWANDELITLTASVATFASTHVGRAYHITGADGTVIRCEVMAYTSTTVVSVLPHITVPVAMRSTAFTNWSAAINSVSGLWHLEGESVSVFGDGHVVASPKNEAYVILTVTNGVVTLDDNYGVIHIGLPYISDLETLSIDTPQGETVSDKQKLINKVSLRLEKTRGVFVGTKQPTDDADDPIEDLFELKLRNLEPYADPIELTTDVVDINCDGTWNNNGRVFIRQIDPVPMTVLSIAPVGLVPFRG